MKKVLAMILAGGKGERLYPLTRDRAKPAVPFGAAYRIIDFTLSNCINSGIRWIYILTQYKSLSLDRHIQTGWNFLSMRMGEFINVIPAQQRIHESWYQGTADAIFQNIYTLQMERPDLVLVLSGDHVYKMDYGYLIDHHLKAKADLTIATIEVDKKYCKEFGVIQGNRQGKIVGFQEKPATPKTVPHNPDAVLINMGVYLFNTETLVKRLIEDAKNKDTEHDFGKNIIPLMIKRDQVFSFPFTDRKTKMPGYWRDVGTLEAYWETSMDMLSEQPKFDVYDPDWPIQTYEEGAMPAKIEGRCEKDGIVYGSVFNSIISRGCLIRTGYVERSLLSPNVTVEPFSVITDSILMNNVTVGKSCRIQRAIIDKGVRIPDGTEIGFNAKADCKRFTVTDSGIVVIQKGTAF
jgi:glucose-1-phosphate adenylyltransferase